MQKDSMNVESDMDISQELYDQFATQSPRKYGSFTENEDLGKSHYNESVGSIHNLCKL